MSFFRSEILLRRVLRVDVLKIQIPTFEANSRHIEMQG